MATSLPEVVPEQREAYAQAVAERRAQAAASVIIPEDHRGHLLELLGQGVSTREAETALGVPRSTVWRYLDRLRADGDAEVRGKGRAARWHRSGTHAA